eukprot:1663477-Pleurochrysis_carterae.AAC.1
MPTRRILDSTWLNALGVHMPDTSVPAASSNFFKKLNTNLKSLECRQHALGMRRRRAEKSHDAARLAATVEVKSAYLQQSRMLPVLPLLEAALLLFFATTSLNELEHSVGSV